MTTGSTVSRRDDALTRRMLRVIDDMSMYRLTSLLLIGIALIAAVVAAIPGVLWITPWQVLGSMALSVASNVVFTQIFARMMHASPQAESAVISGLILGFLMSPVLDGTAVVSIIVANLAAAGSKFVIAYRTRHFLNPAAFGAAFVTLTAPFTHLYASLWWVGTGVLLPFVLIAGVIIGYRLRRLGRLTVVALLCILPSIINAVGHADVALWWATTTMIASASPIWFLAIFMMTEPLTMRDGWAWKWGVATVVVALAIPLVTPITVPTEAALLLGNLVVFVCHRRTLPFATAVISTPTFVAPDIARWTITPSQPLTFQAGQYVELDVPHHADRRGRRRIFSIVGVPTEPSFDVVMRVPTPSSSLKRQLTAIDEPTPIRVTTVGGTFTLPKRSTTPLLLVGQGIGITPLISLAFACTHATPERSVELVWSVRQVSDIFTQDFGHAHVTVVTPGDIVDEVRSAVPEHWNVTAEGLPVVIQSLALPSDTATYLSGSPRSVRILRKALRASGMRHIHTDQFTGY